MTVQLNDPRFARFHGMSAEEIAAEHSRLRAEAVDLSERASLEGADADRFDELADTLEYLKLRAASISRLADLASDDRNIEAGTYFTTSTRKDSDPMRDTAARNIERSHKAGRLSDDSAHLVEKLVAEDKTSLTARWAAETGTEAYRGAFGKLIVNPERGHLLWTPEEADAYRKVDQVRGMIEGVGGTGKYLVPFDLDPAIILTSSGSVSPIRDIARVVKTTASAWNGVSSAGVTAEWLAEAAQAADASPTLAPAPIPVFKQAAWIPFSYELEEDGLQLITQLQGLLADGALQLENTAFITGNGTTQPKGIVTALVAAGGSVIVAGTGSEALVAADLYKLQGALGSRFQPKAVFAGNLGTLNTIRQFETTNGALKFPGAQEVPANLLGRPLHEVSNMDGVINPTATENNYVLIYGDFSNYVVVDRIGTTVELVPHVFGANGRPTGERGLFMHRRVGGDVVNANAFRLLNVPTTA